MSRDWKVSSAPMYSPTASMRAAVVLCASTPTGTERLTCSTSSPLKLLLALHDGFEHVPDQLAQAPLPAGSQESLVAGRRGHAP